jgi:N6-L-threonylcarbamoyladenine synthase/protein kinase Bud32
MRVLGVEGTAWAASAAVYDTDTDAVAIETDPYEPETGGIDPSEAAEHMRAAIPRVIEAVLDDPDLRGPVGPPESRLAVAATDLPDAGESAVADPPVDAVAFSRGPGLGPCLRVVGSAARAVAGTYGVPLVGVNHMLAHAEVGRHGAGFDRPVAVNASGANAHVLGYRAGRYRVLGETMDTGVGNALDKFARGLDWSHPGGPKVERAARDGEYVDLPYVVKGMDLSFSGLASAAAAAVEDHPVADVCRGLEETVFAQVTEVTERALALTGADELVLGGGVAQNDRLQGMLREMCDQRGAAFYVPEPRLLRDNAGMIAVLGARMAAAGDTLSIADSRVRPDFRPDEVPVTWREDDGLVVGYGGDRRRGAEAVVEPTSDAAVDDRSLDGTAAGLDTDGGTVDALVAKERRPKAYRHPDLDARLRRERTRAEARLTALARREGVSTPVLVDVDPEEGRIVAERVGDRDLAELLADLDDPTASGDGTAADAREHVRRVARSLATLHAAGVVHADPTARNVRVGERTWLIDFGLGYHTDHVEDRAMDLHVFEGSLAGVADDPGPLVDCFRGAYREAGDPAVLDRLATIDRRGRYRER